MKSKVTNHNVSKFLTEIVIFRLLPLVDMESKFTKGSPNLTEIQIYTLIKIELAVSGSKIKFIPEEEVVEPNVTNLAKLLFVSKSKISRLIDSLVKQGLVKRTEDKIDRRKLKLSITPKGKKYLDDFYQDRFTLIKGILTEFSEEDLDRFTGYLDKFNHIVYQRINN